MEKVVYILGAGFSAPLGLPVIDNFYSKSKDMYFNDHDKYGYFKGVIKKIDELSKIKNYYKTDLFNIEEILSILEMERYISGKKTLKEIVNYIKAVIEYYTPKIEDSINLVANLPKQNWTNYLFGKKPWNYYGAFFSCIHNLKYIYGVDSYSGELSRQTIFRARNKNYNTEYSIITLNYDAIPVNFCKFINTYFRKKNSEDIISFNTSNMPEKGSNFVEPSLSKLHGCVTKNIIPPTWNKIASKEIIIAWKIAYKLLSEVNHIRILGYSLPITDSYVKYLFKSAVIQAENLKSIDILCLDNDGSVKKRYEEFIKFKNQRFRNKDLNLYFNYIYEYNVDKNPLRGNNEFVFDKLEEAHHAFFLKEW